MKRFACVLLTLCAALTLSAQRIHPDYMDGMVYFQLKPDYPLHLSVWDGHDRLVGEEFPFFTEIFRKYEVNSVLRPFHLFGDEGLLRVVELHFGRAQAVDSLVEELQRNEWTVYAEKVPVRHLHAVPNDPYYGVVKGLNWRWPLDMIKADSAWDIQQGSPDIKVAIIDSYVWGAHPDLQIDSANLCTVTYDADSGYIYTVGSATPPPIYPQDSSETSHEISHGTHCAGLAGAVSNNGIGIASIGSGLTLMGVATGSDEGMSSLSHHVEGIQWAAEHGADVISMSFGAAKKNETEKSLLQVCYNHGIVLVASAGNSGFTVNEKNYPAVYPTVISVASVDGDGKLSCFSQWGRDRADIAAPGGYISGYAFGGEYPNMLSTTYGMSCVMKDSGFSGTFYDGMQGTSMSCPIVAGLAGLMLSKDSTLGPDVIRNILQTTATPLNPASEHTLGGYGYVNAFKALQKDGYVVLSKDSVRFPKNAGQRDTLKIMASAPWTLSGLPEWLYASAVSGGRGVTEVVITCLSDNNDGADRVASLIAVSERKDSATLTVCQMDVEYSLRFDRKTICFEADKWLKDTLYVFANVSWQMENNADWLVCVKNQLARDTFAVIMATNSDNMDEVREGMLLFTSDYLPEPDTVFVYQKSLNDTMDVADVRDLDWSLSPNPTSGTVLCRFPKGEATELCVYDTQGRLLKRLEVKGEELLLDLSDAAPGCYLIRYGKCIRRLIKK